MVLRPPPRIAKELRRPIPMFFLWSGTMPAFASALAFSHASGSREDEHDRHDQQ